MVNSLIRLLILVSLLTSGAFAQCMIFGPPYAFSYQGGANQEYRCDVSNGGGRTHLHSHGDANDSEWTFLYDGADGF